MKSLNDSLKSIELVKVIIIGILALALIFIANELFNTNIDEIWMYIVILIYILYRLRHHKAEWNYNFHNIFSKISFKRICLIVLLNIFFSYGMLYCFNYITTTTTLLDPLLCSLIAISSFKVIGTIGNFISTVFIAPASEEFIFRGVILNRFQLVANLPYAILISSFLFGVLHEPGSIFSAFIFGICMCILYLRTKNILVPIFAHFLNNLIAEILYFVDVNNLIFTDPLIIFGFSALAIISLYLILISLKQEWKHLKYYET